MLDLRQCALGIEFGSTRIKAVLVDGSHAPVAQGDFTWENQLKDGVWTYPLEAVHTGLQHAYAALAADVQAKYGQPLTTVGCIGISAMMHGYLAFDGAGRLLVPFRTWRNTMTGPAAAELTERSASTFPSGGALRISIRRFSMGRDIWANWPSLQRWRAMSIGSLPGKKCWAWAMPAACSPSTAPPAAMMPKCSRPAAA